MEKIKIVFIFLFILLFSKILIYGNNLPDCVIGLGILSVILFYEILPSNKKFEGLKNEIELLKKENNKLYKDIDELKTRVASLQLTSGIRGIK